MKRLHLLFAVGLLLVPIPDFANVASYCDSIAGNLVKNCGFEMGNFSWWDTSNIEVTPGGHALTSVLGALDIGPNTGQYYAGFGNVNSDATVSQTIQTTVGQGYDFSLFYAADGSKPHDFSVLWDGSVLLATPSQRTDSWVKYSFAVYGTGSDNIEFLGSNQYGYDGLDDVSLTVPEPALAGFCQLFLGGLVMMLRRRRA